MTQQNEGSSRWKDLRRLLAYLPRTLQLVWEAARGWTAAWVTMLLFRGVLPGAIVYLTKAVLDGAEAALGQGLDWTNAQQLLIPAALMAGALALEQIMKSVNSWIQTAQAELVQDHVDSLVHEKAIEVDFSFYESSEYFDRLHQASSQAGSKSLQLLNSLGSLLQNGITLVTIALLLIPYGVWIPVALLLSTLPALYVVVRYNRKHHAWWKRTTGDRRRTQYFKMILTHDYPAAEMRLFDLGTYFKEAYDDLRDRLRGEKLELEKERSYTRLLAGLFGLVVTGSVMGWMVWRALLGTASLGDLGLFYQAFNRGQSLLNTVLSSLGQVYASALFVEHLFEFLGTESSVTDPDEPRVPAAPKKNICFENVAFRYPGATTPVLSGFDLEIPAEQVTALVGANGAGKSTLLKLLCRLYDPQEGAVTLDDQDIRSFTVDDWQDQLAVMFQQPMRYQASAAENIRMGNRTSTDGRERVVHAAKNALAHEFIEKLPQGYDTHLGKWFPGGVEVSGGQWQRASLARAFFRQAPIVILDEPTSAMDSWAEHEWLKQFGALTKGRTALIITHRFTTAMHADVIYAMREGEIVESGTHDSLLEEEGYYAESWKNQVEKGWRTPSQSSSTKTADPLFVNGH